MSPDPLSPVLNIGAFVDSYGAGGSHNSAATLCNALARRGHCVTFYYPVEHSLLHVVPAVPVVDLPLHRWAPHLVHNITPRNRRIALREARARKHNVLLTFTWPSLFIATGVSCAMRIPCWHYQLGTGWFPPPSLHRGPFIANCEETRDKLAAAFGLSAEEVPVVRGRVNIDQLLASANRALTGEGKNDINARHRVGMMSRLDVSKEAGLTYSLRAFENLAMRRCDVEFLIAGDGVRRDGIQNEADALNARVGRNAVRLLGSVVEVGAFLARNEVNIGVGRCAFESMALGKPTLVVGNTGFAGVVEPETLEQLAYYNLSGRNVPADAVLPPEALADRLDAILSSATERHTLGVFAREAFKRMFVDDQGAIGFERVFLESRVRNTHKVDGSLWARLCHYVNFLNWRARMFRYSLKRFIVAHEEWRTHREHLRRLASRSGNA